MSRILQEEACIRTQCGTLAPSPCMLSFLRIQRLGSCLPAI